MTPAGTLRKSLSALGIALASGALTAGWLVHDRTVPTAAACTNGTMSRLYLGSSMREGTVSELQWREFVAAAVDPRFPGGFTELPAQGRWRDAHGVRVEEKTRILEIAHDDAARTHDQVRAIAADYRRRFAQDAVLLTQTRAALCLEQHGAGSALSSAPSVPGG